MGRIAAPVALSSSPPLQRGHVSNHLTYLFLREVAINSDRAQLALAGLAN